MYKIVKEKPSQVISFSNGVMIDVNKLIVFKKPMMVEQECIFIGDLMEENGISSDDLRKAVDFSIVTATDVKNIPFTVGPKLVAKTSKSNRWKVFYYELEKIIKQEFKERNPLALREGIDVGTRLLQAMIQNDKINMLELKKSLKETLKEEVEKVTSLAWRDMKTNKNIIADVITEQVIEQIRGDKSGETSGK